MIVMAANVETLSDLQRALVKAKSHIWSLDEQLDALAKAYLTFAVNRTLEWRALFEHRLTTKTSVPEWYREAQAALFAIVEELRQPVIVVERSRSEAARALFSAVHEVISIALDQKLGTFDRAASPVYREVDRTRDQRQPPRLIGWQVASHRGPGGRRPASASVR